MDPIPHLLATRVLPDPLQTEGTTEPLLLECAHISNLANPSTYLVKFNNTNPRNGTGITSEIIASYLAEHFEIPSPEFATVEIPTVLYENEYSRRPMLSDAIINILAQNKTPYNFGSKWISTNIGVPLSINPKKENGIIQAQKILAFDALLYNADRTRDCPNLLSHEGQYHVIDHEKAFLFLHNDQNKPEQWKFLDSHGECFLLNHIFYPQIKGLEQLDFSEFVMQLEQLSDKIIDEILKQVPYQIRIKEDIQQIQDYLSYARLHAKDFQTSLMRILA